MLGGTALTNLYRMDPIADGNPIGWTIKTLGTQASEDAGAGRLSADRRPRPISTRWRAVLPDLEACARELYATKRNTVKHNRGTHIFEAGNIRFGLEMRRQMSGDGGLAIHVMADIGGTPGKNYTEETELLAFDHFWKARITITARATRTIASIGTGRWSKTRSPGRWSSSRPENCRR